MTKIVKIPCKLYTQNKGSSTIDLSKNNILDLSELGDITLSLEYNPFNRPIITSRLTVQGNGSNAVHFQGDYWVFNKIVYPGVILSNSLNILFSQFNNKIYLK